METEKENKYTVTFKYKNEDIKFENIIKNYINNLTKLPVEYWHLQDYSLKYK